MKRFGIMGGTFNPIHLAHIYIAYEAKEALELDKVIFLPSGNPPHKKGNKIIDAKYRFDMVKYAIQDYEGFTIDDYEIKNSGYSYTCDTLMYYKNEDIEIYFISGADSFMDIEKWKNPDVVLSNCVFVTFNRGQYKKEELILQKEYLEKKYKAKIVLLDIVNMDISSTMIRKRIKDSKRVDFFLPEKVLNYIQDNNLYEVD